eukprot:142752-Rhodomonas_salina.1
MDDYWATTSLGMRTAGRKQINIGEVDRRLKLQLDSAKKVFTTLEAWTEQMRVCALTKIIRDGCKREGAEGEAWKLANNMLVATQAQ